MKREARKNPERAIPRKERKIMAEEAAKAAAEAKAAAGRQGRRGAELAHVPEKWEPVFR